MRPRLLRAATVALLLAPVAAAPFHGAAASDQTSPAAGIGQVGLGEVLRALHVEAVPADTVVVVDTSGSMRVGGVYDSVRSALRSLLAALPPGDHLDLLTFDTTPTLRYSGAVGRPPGAVGRLPPRPDGEFTDIGAAIDAALRELERPHAGRVGALVLITDGRDEPPPGSAFAAGAGSAWSALRQRAARLGAEGHEVAAYALALRPDTDAGLLARAFPGALVLALPAGQLGPFLQRVRERLRLDKARSLLAGERATVEVRWPTEQLGHLERSKATTDLELVLTSTARHVPVEVTDLAVRSDDGTVRAAGLPARVLLRPGERRTVTLRLPLPHRGGLAAVRRTVRRQVDLRLTASVSTPWDDVLRDDLDLDLRPSLLGGTVKARTSDTSGPSPGALALGGLALLGLLAAARFLVTVRRPSLRGTLTVVPPGLPPVQVRLAGRRLRVGRHHNGLPIPGAGVVSGRRSRDPHRSRHRVDLRIRYSAGRRRRQRATCPPGATATVDGTSFTYHAR